MTNRSPQEQFASTAKGIGLTGCSVVLWLLAIVAGYGYLRWADFSGFALAVLVVAFLYHGWLVFSLPWTHGEHGCLLTGLFYAAFVISSFFGPARVITDPFFLFVGAAVMLWYVATKIRTWDELAWPLLLLQAGSRRADEWIKKRQLARSYASLGVGWIARFRGEASFTPLVGEPFCMGYSFEVEAVDPERCRERRVLEQRGMLGDPALKGCTHLRELVEALEGPLRSYLNYCYVESRGKKPQFYKIEDGKRLADQRGVAYSGCQPVMLPDVEDKLRDLADEHLSLYGLRIAYYGDLRMPFRCEEFKRGEPKSEVMEPEIVDDTVERQFSDELQQLRSQSEEILGESLPAVPTDLLRYDGWLSEVGKVWRMKAKQRTLQTGLSLISQHTALCRALLERRSLRSGHDVQMAQDHATLVECDERIKKAEFGAAEWTQKLNALLHAPEGKAKLSTEDKIRQEFARSTGSVVTLAREANEARTKWPEHRDLIDRLEDDLRNRILDGRL